MSSYKRLAKKMQKWMDVCFDGGKTETEQWLLKNHNLVMVRDGAHVFLAKRPKPLTERQVAKAMKALDEFMGEFRA